MLTSAVIAAACGVVIGILAGLLGIGGGTMIIPVLRLGFGVATLQATATSLFTIILTSCSGAIGHLRNRTANLKAGLSIGVVGACVAPLGTPLSHHLGNLQVMLLSGCVFLYIASNMIRKGLRMPRRGERQAADGSATRGARAAAADAGLGMDADAQVAPEVPQAPDVPLGQTATSFSLTPGGLARAALIGAGAGIASSVLGIGGGFIIIPLCMTFFGFSMKEASGTSLVAIIPLATTGTIAHALAGDVVFLYGLAIALGSIPGALVGARISRRAPERTLRLLFGGVLIAMTIVLVLNELGVLS